MVQEHNKRTDEAARVVLGGMLRSVEAIAEVALLLQAADFRTYADQAVFSAVLDLWRDGKPVDVVSVGEELHRRRQLADAPPAYLAELVDSCPAPSSVAHYARVVRDQALLRELARVSGEILYRAQHPDDDVARLIEQAERDILAIGERKIVAQAVCLRDVLAGVMDRIDQRVLDYQDGKLPGVPTGITVLDEMTGGLRSSELAVFGARPATGKTAVAAVIAAWAASCGHRVLFCSLEQTNLDLGERLLAGRAGVDLQLIRVGALADEHLSDLQVSEREMRHVPLHLVDSATQSTLSISAHARRLKSQGGLGLIVIDYLQLIGADDPRLPRHEQVAAISRNLKGLAKDLCVPVLALSQLNRLSEQRADKKPMLSDIRESGGVEQDADLVVLLHRAADKPNILEMNVAKQRSGPTGEFTVYFDRARMRITNDVSTPFSE